MAKAFFSVARLRHVKVDSGFHMIDRQAWRYCHSLQIVKLPDTVVAIEYAAFQGCSALVMVEVPGCVDLGVSRNVVPSRRLGSSRKGHAG